MKKITKAELEKIYRANTNQDACKILGISNPTLIKYIKESGIAPKGSGYGNEIRRNKIEVTDE